MAPITALYGSLAGILLLVFASYAIVMRGRRRVGLGDGGDPAMLCAIRIHGNAAEYIPITVILMALFELLHGSPTALHVAGLCMVIGRIAHAIGLAGSANTSIGRLLGITSAFVAILIPAIGSLTKLFAT
jgi:uncharacterized membrane protein YecN with MAPEG domain